MRTSVDIPDSLMARVKERTREKNISFRSLVIEALEDSLLEEEKPPFSLRDASVGEHGHGPVSAEKINEFIDDSREPGGSF